MATSGPNLQLVNDRGYMTVDISTAADGLSDVVSLKGHMLAAVQASTAWTAANLTFLGCLDSTAYHDVYTSTGGELTLTATTSGRMITLSADEQDRLRVFDKLKIRSGTTTLAVAQGAVRTLTLGLVPLK